jgi:hypothetical protein
MANIVQSPQIVDVRDTFTALTTGTLDGKGLFDELMVSVKQHLLEEFAQNRIRGSEYAKVYLGSMESVLGNTVQYLLGMSLIGEQKAKIALEIEKLKKELALFPLQEQKLKADVGLAQVQVRIAELEAEVIPLKKNQITAETTRVQHETERLRYEIDHLLPLEEAKFDLANKKITSEIGMVDAQLKTIDWQYINALPRELAKLNSEIRLYDAKVASEQKQPELSDWQMRLFEKQIWGYDRDAEQKLAKIYADVWSVQKSVDEGIQVPPGMQNPELHRAMNKLLGGMKA